MAAPPLFQSNERICWLTREGRGGERRAWHGAERLDWWILAAYLPGLSVSQQVLDCAAVWSLVYLHLDSRPRILVQKKQKQKKKQKCGGWSASVNWGVGVRDRSSGINVGTPSLCQMAHRGWELKGGGWIFYKISWEGMCCRFLFRVTC